MQDAVGLAAEVDTQFVTLRNSTREKIFDYMERRSSLAIHPRRLPDLARRLEEILFRRYPNKIEYCNMMRGPIEPHLHFAAKLLIVQNRQLSREITCSPPYWTMTVTPGITQGAGENSRMSLVTGNIGPLSGPDMVPMNPTWVPSCQRKLLMNM